MTLNYESPPGYSVNLSSEQLRGAVSPLRMIFWGGMLLIFDISFSETRNGEGFRFDILDNTVGMILICIGVFRLAKIPVSGRYANMMAFVKVISILNLISSIDWHFIYHDPPFLSCLRALLSIAILVAIVLFCSAMCDLARQAALMEPARSWQTTRLLFIIIYVIPLGLLYLAGLSAMLGATPSVNINLGVAGLPLLFVFVIPVIHLFVSTSRFRRAIESRAAVARIH